MIDQDRTPLFICRTDRDAVDIQEAETAEELKARRPDILEAYRLTAAQETELFTAWGCYWDRIRDTDDAEPRARELLAAVVRSVYRRAKAGQAGAV